MDSAMSPADMRAVLDGSNYGDGCGCGMGGGWLSWILIFALLGGGFGGFGGWGNREGNFVTEADLCNANSFSELKNSVGRLNDNQAAIARQTDNAICQLGYQNLQNTNAISSQLADCCCTTQRAIDSVKFDMANYSAATNAAITAGTQKILDKMCADQTAALQARVQSLELQQALCGIPRTSPYGYGIYAYPACSGFTGYTGCNTCTNI